MSTPSPEAKKPNPIKAAWRRFKDRMKLTWIGWFYICARRTPGGSVLLFCILLSLIPVSMGLFGYLALRPYASWDDLPCQTGTLLKFHSAPGGRGESTGTLVDSAGVEHKFYGRSVFGNNNRTRLNGLVGQEIKVCYVYQIQILPPFYMRDVRGIYYPDGTDNRKHDETIEDAREFYVRLITHSLLWLTLPILLWLLKRHGREAWRERNAYRQSLSVTPHSNL